MNKPVTKKFRKDVNVNIPDESKAVKEYARISREQRKQGNVRVANIFRGMSRDEANHRKKLRRMKREYL